jgi:methyltransferase-like protein 23
MRRCLPNKKILEIGAGTALPGILAAKIGANVILSENAFLSKSLAHIKRICATNLLKVGVMGSRDGVRVVGLTWGMMPPEIGNDLDLIIGSDCLYDCSIFEDVLSTLSFLLEQNQKATAIIAYQLRSSDWSIENLLKKYHLKTRNIDLESISEDCGMDVKDLMEGHSIFLLEIYRA